MTTRSSNGTSRPPSLSGWQARAVHTITLPSGQRVRIRIPGIATLLEHGDLPDDLVELALAEVTKQDGAAGEVSQFIQDETDNAKRLAKLTEFAGFQRQLVCAAVTEVERNNEWETVELSPTDLDDLPEDDLAMVAEIVQRLRGTDARGVRIGVAPLDRFAAFREAHGCPDENCEGCGKLVEVLSSADLGAM